MNRDDIICMAREAGWTDYSLLHSVEVRRLEQFAALVAAHEREAAIRKIESEICHAEINGLRLAPLFGQSEGALAVRVDSLAAIIDAIRARGEA